MNKRRRNSRRRRRRRNNSTTAIIILSILLVATVIILAIVLLTKNGGEDKNSTSISINPNAISVVSPSNTENTTEAVIPGETEIIAPTEETTTKRQYSSDELLAEAQRIAAMYDYDTAISMLTSSAEYETNAEYKSAVEEFTAEKSHLVKWADNTQITHIFFHTLIVDNQLAFSDRDMAGNYNTVMTTIPEFNAIIQSMYDKGYVMVSLHDVAKMVPQADGSMVMTYQPIYLPAGKIPFVLSQDDVSYYQYMDGDGYPDRLVVTADGKIKNEMRVAGGQTVTGSFDMVPLIDDFVEEHPDFSYRGAKGVIALTGYEGVLGYRTSDYHYGPDCAANDPKYQSPNPNIETDKATAKHVADVMKAEGWEFATHGWGHIAMGANRAYDGFVWDLDLWINEVTPIIGPTDIIIYPKGDDIGSFRMYTDTERQTELAVQKYNYAKSRGFNYFCNVDGSTPYWVQLSPEYLRMARINADGQALYEAVVDYRNKLSHIFTNDEIRAIFDPDRPTPVPGVPVS